MEISWTDVNKFAVDKINKASRQRRRGCSTAKKQLRQSPGNPWTPDVWNWCIAQ
jgi:hypothetical protein